ILVCKGPRRRCFVAHELRLPRLALAGDIAALPRIVLIGFVSVLVRVFEFVREVGGIFDIRRADAVVFVFVVLVGLVGLVRAVRVIRFVGCFGVVELLRVEAFFADDRVDVLAGEVLLAVARGFLLELVDARLVDGDVLAAKLLEVLLGHRLDVESPAGQLRCEADVLAALSDRERLLVRTHVDDRALVLEVEVDRGDLRRTQRVDDEDLDRVAPAHDVDLLAEELVDDVLDPRAAHADAGADAVDVRIVRAHRDLRPVARLARDPLDLDDALRDLRHLELEERAHEIGARPRERDLDAVRVLLEVLDEDLDAIADLELLAGHLLAARQEALDLAEVDDQVHAFLALDRSNDEGADLLRELLVDPVALCFADLLEENLLSRKSRQTT